MQKLGAVLLALVLAGSAAAQEAAAPPPSSRIEVVGEGRITAVPDMATVTLGVTSEAQTAKAAMDQTSEGVAALLERLRGAGIEARDLQTSGLSLGPVWSQSRDGSEPPRITGYSAANTVTVRVRNLEALGVILDGAIDTGVNTLQGISFGLQDPEPRLDEARAAAVADARRKAELYAGAAGVDLGRILHIAEQGGMEPPQPMYRMEMAAASGVPVAAGETELTARVTIVWEIGG